MIDYGIAKILDPQAERGAEQTQAGFIGTPAFASPEQFAPSEQIANRYAFGHLLVRRDLLVFAFRPGAICWAHARRHSLKADRAITN